MKNAEVSRLENLSVKDICQFLRNAQKLPIAEAGNLQLSLSERTSCCTEKCKTLDPAIRRTNGQPIKGNLVKKV